MLFYYIKNYPSFICYTLFIVNDAGEELAVADGAGEDGVDDNTEGKVAHEDFAMLGCVAEDVVVEGWNECPECGEAKRGI